MSVDVSTISSQISLSGSDAVDLGIAATLADNASGPNVASDSPQRANLDLYRNCQKSELPGVVVYASGPGQSIESIACYFNVTSDLIREYNPGLREFFSSEVSIRLPLPTGVLQ
jgi:hypothetical protein